MPDDVERPPISPPGPVPADELPRQAQGEYPLPSPPLAASEPSAHAGRLERPDSVTADRQPALGLILSFAAALLVGGLAFAALGDPKPTAEIPVLETTGLFYWLATVVIMAVVGIGAQYAEFTAASAAAAMGELRHISPMPSAWAIPVTATFASSFLVATYHNGWMLLLGPLVTFIAIAGALLARDLLEDQGEAAHRVAALIHTLDVHFVALIALGTIYLNKLPDWLGPALIAVVTIFLIIESFERSEIGIGQRLGYAGISGIAIWQIALVVNWWPTHGWTGGMVLLVCFYLIAGILMVRAQQGVVRVRDVAWYGGLASVAILILALTA